MAGVRLIMGPYQYLGAALTTGKLYHYASGTDTLKHVYVDRDETIEEDQPVLCDSNGVFTFFASVGLYKFVLTDANDAVISTWDETEIK